MEEGGPAPTYATADAAWFKGSFKWGTNQRVQSDMSKLLGGSNGCRVWIEAP